MTTGKRTCSCGTAHPACGQDVIRDDAASFVCSSGMWPAGGRVQPLDRDGDGRDELLRYDARTGSWTLIGVSPSGEVTPGGRCVGAWLERRQRRSRRRRP